MAHSWHTGKVTSCLFHVSRCRHGCADSGPVPALATARISPDAGMRGQVGPARLSVCRSMCYLCCPPGLDAVAARNPSVFHRGDGGAVHGRDLVAFVLRQAHAHLPHNDGPSRVRNGTLTYARPLAHSRARFSKGSAQRAGAQNLAKQTLPASTRINTEASPGANVAGVSPVPVQI